MVSSCSIILHDRNLYKKFRIFEHKMYNLRHNIYRVQNEFISDIKLNSEPKVERNLLLNLMDGSNSASFWYFDLLSRNTARIYSVGLRILLTNIVSRINQLEVSSGGIRMLLSSKSNYVVSKFNLKTSPLRSLIYPYRSVLSRLNVNQVENNQ